MARPTVLIADDDAGVRTALRIRLLADGYDVLECWDGLGVVAKSRSHAIDAIILDHEMPCGEGRSIARSLREHTDAPIVFLSGHEREEFPSIVESVPDVYYLPKPLDSGKLKGLLGSLVCVG